MKYAASRQHGGRRALRSAFVVVVSDWHVVVAAAAAGRHGVAAAGRHVVAAPAKSGGTLD